MPRLIDPALQQMLERANPNVAHFVELNVPDTALVLRRALDQFLAVPPKVAESPAASIEADGAGALTLKRSAATLSFHSTGTNEAALPRPNPAKHLQGLAWIVDPNFGRGVLRSFTARIKLNASGVPLDSGLQLQIYRVVGQAGHVNGTTAAVAYTFVPLLAQPITKKQSDVVWSGGVADVVFDLSTAYVEVGSNNLPAPSTARTGEKAVYYFVIEPVNASRDDDFFWIYDLGTAQDNVFNIGTFTARSWDRTDAQANDATAWVETSVNQVPRFSCDLQAFVATSEVVYSMVLPAAPTAASVGRIVFESGIPVGTSATLELSVAGFGGPYGVVKHDDPIPVKLPSYYLRLTMNASANQRLAPRVAALGIEFKIPVDVTAEAIVENVGQAIEVPFCKAAISEGQVEVVRTGRRDYHDAGADIAVSSPVSKIEADILLGSRHPAVTRDKWLRLSRAFVNDRQPTATAERFSLLSQLKLLKKKIPARVETINSVHVVQAGTTASLVIVSPNLPGTTVGGNEYDFQGYYLRVRQSAQAGVESGYQQDINGSTDLQGLDFSPALRGVLAPGDLVEVHSQRWVQPALTWIDADPADVWLEILTNYLAIPLERIGRADLGRVGRSGLPPKISDRAPGDAFTQNRLKVTLHVEEAQAADELLDQLSFIMGGSTVEIAGQIVFRQIYPLRDASGRIVVDAEAVAAVFDLRNTASHETPVGLEGRVTTMACDWGVNTTTVAKETPPALTVVYADGDALAYLDAQSVEELGKPVVPKEISRWCYNSADGGKFLASALCEQVVRAASTGLRVWPWTANEAHPELVVGDRVVVVTDKYTDFDPTRKVQIRGWWAYQLVVIAVANNGRSFRGFMLGLHDAVKVRGGGGTLPTATDLDTLVVKAVPVSRSPLDEEHDVTVYDPRGGAQITLEHTDLGTVVTRNGGGPDPFVLSGNPDGSTYRFTCTRPEFATGKGRSSFEARAVGRVRGQASIDVPEMARDTVPSRLALSKLNYNAGTSKYELWFRYYVTLQDGTEVERTNSLIWAVDSLAVVIRNALTGAPATGVGSLTPAYSGTVPGYKLSWDSLDTEAWSFHAMLGVGGQSWNGVQAAPRTGAHLDLALPPATGGAVSYPVKTGEVGVVLVTTDYGVIERYGVVRGAGVSGAVAAANATNLQNALNSVHAMGGGIVDVPAAVFVLDGDIQSPRSASLRGPLGEMAILRSYGGFQRNFDVKGNTLSIGDQHLIEGLQFDRVRLRYGVTSTDLGRGCTTRSCGFVNSDYAIYYGYNCYHTLIDDCHFRLNNRHIWFDFATAVSGAGAGMFVTNSVLSETPGEAILMSGATGDGYHIYIVNVIADVLSGKFLRTASVFGDGLISIKNVSLELISDCFIENDGANILIDGIWALSAIENYWFYNRAGVIMVKNGRVAWIPNKFARIEAGIIQVDPTSMLSGSSRWFGAGSQAMTHARRAAGRLCCRA
jgi:hypothetical protein